MAQAQSYSRLGAQLGIRKLSPTELIARGFSRGSERYVTPSGETLSKRQFQQRMSDVLYGERVTLERRAEIRRATKAPNPRFVRDSFVRAVQRGGNGGKGYKSFREAERSAEFKQAWESYQRIRHRKGRVANQQRIKMYEQWGMWKRVRRYDPQAGRYRYTYSFVNPQGEGSPEVT